MSIFVRPWCILELLDSHVRNEKKREIQLQPFSETQLRMKNYGIQSQCIQDSFDSYVKTRSSKAVWEELTMGKDLYFQILAPKKSTPERKMSSLSLAFCKTTMPMQLSFLEAPILPISHLSVHPLDFKYKVRSAGALTVKNGKGKLVFADMVTKQQAFVTLKLEDFGTDVYEVYLNDQLMYTFLGTDQDIAETCIGIVQLQMDTMVTLLQQSKLPKFALALSHMEEYTDFLQQDNELEKLIAPPYVAESLPARQKDSDAHVKTVPSLF